MKTVDKKSQKLKKNYQLKKYLQKNQNQKNKPRSISNLNKVKR